VEGFSGANCSVNVDECAQHLCQNGATCVDGVAAYTCLCAADFSGRFCEVPFLSKISFLKVLKSRFVRR
jgi:slit 2